MLSTPTPAAPDTNRSKIYNYVPFSFVQHIMHNLLYTYNGNYDYNCHNRKCNVVACGQDFGLACSYQKDNPCMIYAHISAFDNINTERIKLHFF